MKVAIDTSAMDNQSKGRGIGFYTENLIKSLRQYTSWEVQVIEKKDQKVNADIIHFPYFDFFRPTLHINSHIPTVVTIHDVIPLLFPSQYPSGLKGKVNLLRQKLSLRKVKAVITDSKTSTQDSIKVFNLPKAKVFTVYLSQADHFNQLPHPEVERIRLKYQLPEEFVIYTGGVNWNKNLVRMTQAVIDAQVPLVLVGGGFETKGDLNHPELQPFREFKERYSNHPGVKILGFIPNEDLVGLLNAALGLLLVSHYEGFGLPVLEAQASGTAVITSDNSSLKEVVGDGGIMVDAAVGSDITNAVIKLKNEKFRKELIKKGTANLKRFSWEKTAKETVKVYEYAISQK